MLYAYIGVSLVVGLLVGFVTLSVVWTARTVEKSVRARSVTLLSAFDDLLEERSRRLDELEEEIGRKKAEKESLERSSVPEVGREAAGAAPASLLSAAERISTTDYLDRGVGDTYRKIREAFGNLDKRVGDTYMKIQAEYDVPCKDMAGRIPAPGKKSGSGVAGRLLKELSFDTVFGLSTLPEDQQLKLLTAALPEEYGPFLKEYAAGHRRFDAIGFYDAIKEAAASEPGEVLVRVPPARAAGEYPKGVRVIADENICEGFQIEADNVLYDYCIKTRELS